MIELSNGEITLRPLASADRKQWRRVRAVNKDWLEEWEATVPKTSKSDELKSALGIPAAGLAIALITFSALTYFGAVMDTEAEAGFTALPVLLFLPFVAGLS